MFTKKPPTVRVGTARVGGSATIPTVQQRDIMLRTDIGCGIRACQPCAATAEGEVPVLDVSRNLMIPDSNVLLLYVNLLEESNLENIVFLSSVLAEVQAKNRAIYARLQRVVSNAERASYVFSNLNHAHTACKKKEGESNEDFDARCMQVAAAWYHRHHGSIVTSDADAAVTKGKVFLVTHTETRRSELESAENAYEVRTFRQYVEESEVASAKLLEKIHSVGEVLPLGPTSGQAYAPHLPEAQLLVGIDGGQFLKGKLKVGETSCFFGEVRGRWNPPNGEGIRVSGLPTNTDRIMIAGKFSMNRAVADDIVAVEPLPVSEWRAPQGSKNPPVPSSMEEAVELKFTPTGRIVGIVEMRRRPYCGSIHVDDIEKNLNATGSVSVLFQPKSNRIPRIRIQTRQLHELKDKRLTVVIDEWPETSAAPLGHYVEVLGVIGDKETEAKVILMEHDIPHYDFSQAVYDCLPKGQWKVEEEQEKVRLDLRSYTICSVDPLGCRDIDDALHWRKLANGDVEVGVHIADVTHFMPEGCPMDDEAQKRSTSVYLVDRRINMLPQLLTENLCSIVGNEDRYAFSIIWVFDGETTKVKQSWFGKTIIRSRAALYYGDAQKMIDDPNDTSDIALSLKGLMALSRKLKQARTEAGALFLASQEFKFKTDDEHLNPTDMTKYATFEANSMIEEWMLFANVAAGRRIHEVFPRWALLRRHQPPDQASFAVINEALQEKIGVTLDASSSLALNQSFDKCVDPTDPFFNELVRMMTTRCLRQAQYFSSGEVPYEEYLHYGLAMPIYTHFTSPIRRFADVVVHRQLAATLKIMEVSEQHTNVERINEIAENLNYRHDQAQKAGRESKNLFTGFYLRNFPDGNVPPEPGYVIKVSDTHIFVLVPRYGQESKIDRETLPNSDKYKMFDRVAVGISLKQDGDVMRTKMIFNILGGVELLDKKEVQAGGEVDEKLVASLLKAGEANPDRKTVRGSSQPTPAAEESSDAQSGKKKSRTD